MSEGTRANRITSVFSDGVIVGTFYKTNTKLGQVRSDDEQVVALGYKIPEATEEAQVTANQKLASFKEFLQINATAFGYVYDPVDRRSDANKFPNKYTDGTFVELATQVVQSSVYDVLSSLKKHIVSAEEKGLMAHNEVFIAAGTPVVNIGEAYKSGSLKYADANFPIEVMLYSGDQKTGSFTIETGVKIISGQLRKPREFKIDGEEKPLTASEIKSLAIAKGIVPEIVKEKKEESEAVEEVAAEA